MEIWGKIEMTKSIVYTVTVTENSQEWRFKGKIHRLDGPAIIEGNYQAWYIEGKSYTKEEFDEKTKKSPCVNKEVIIDGVTYKLVPKETS